MKHFIILLLSASTFFSCVDDIDLNPLYTDEELPPTSPNNPDEGLNQEQIDSYFYALNVGNKWVYNVEVQNETQVTTQEVTRLEQVGDTTFYYIKTDESDNEAKTFYNNKIGYGIPPSETDGGSPVLTDEFIKVLDEGLQIEESWEYQLVTEVSGMENKNRYVNTITEKLESLTVNDIEFQDVLFVKQDVFTTAVGTDQEIQLIRADYFWAKNIGLIKIDYYDTFLGSLTRSQTITEYTIN